jgi:hypothetical protein
LQEMRNKEFDSLESGAYKPAPPTRDWDQHPAVLARVGSIFDIVDREKGCVGGGPGTRCSGPERKRIQGRLSLRKRRQPLRVCVRDPNVAYSMRSARTKPDRRG